MNKYVDPSILKCISADKNLLIEELNGKMTFVEAKEIFKSAVFPKEFNGEHTKEGVAEVYNLAKKEVLDKIFFSLTSNYKIISMTWSQVAYFCKKYPEWLNKKANATLFLIKEAKHYYVAIVRNNSNGLSLGKISLGYDYEWEEILNTRVICLRFKTPVA